MLIAFVLWGMESRIEDAVMEQVNVKLKESEDKDDPYQYWDNLW